MLVRMKEDYDGAEPAASSVSVMNLLTLSHLDRRIHGPRIRIRRTLALFGERLEADGRIVPMMAAALSAYHAGLSQIVIVGRRRRGDRGAARHARDDLSAVLRRHPGRPGTRGGVADLLPFTAPWPTAERPRSCAATSPANGPSRRPWRSNAAESNRGTPELRPCGLTTSAGRTFPVTLAFPRQRPATVRQRL